MTELNWRLKQAVKTLEMGGVVAYPTEAVYGLGCDPWNEEAVFDLLQIKQRDWSKGLILIASDFNQLQDFIEPVSPEILQQVMASWPGAVTWLLPARPEVPLYLTGLSDKIAVRVTNHPLAAKLCDAFGGAIVSTSANLSGFRPTRNVHQVRWQLPWLDYILPGAVGGNKNPSQIRDAITGEIIR